jgi:hypothetical protein
MGNSQNYRENKIWEMLNNKNSYKLSTLYLEKFPDSKHIKQVQNFQEQALWDSAKAQNSVHLWDFFIYSFPESKKYTQAKAFHEALLWEGVMSQNTITGYNMYVKSFPNGKFIKKANSAIKRLSRKEKKLIETPSKDLSAPIVEINKSEIESKYGVIKFDDGRRYEGSIINGEPSGRGKEFFPDRTFLEGFYEKGKRNGSFVFHKSDGTKENQEFVNGNRVK